MAMSLLAFRDKFNQGLLSFLWAQWTRLGMLGSGAKSPGIWAIDPEALLLLTLEVSRRDPRLFDEVMDWLDRNDDWINVQRLRNLAAKDPGYKAALLAAMADALNVREPSAKWKNLAEATLARKVGSALPLFDLGGAPSRQLDPAFARHGFRRPPLEWRGLSRPVPTAPASNLYFRLRALWGVSARADILAHLLLRGDSTVPEISASTCYSIPSIRAAAEEMIASSRVYVRRRGRQKRYGLLRREWWPFLYPGTSSQVPPWLDWPRLSRALLRVNRWLRRPDLEQLTPYLQASELGELTREIREDIENSGLEGVPLAEAERDPPALLDWLSSTIQPVIALGPVA